MNLNWVLESRNWIFFFKKRKGNIKSGRENYVNKDTRGNTYDMFRGQGELG